VAYPAEKCGAKIVPIIELCNKKMKKLEKIDHIELF
jgi:hypothetical protein